MTAYACLAQHSEQSKADKTPAPAVSLVTPIEPKLNSVLSQMDAAAGKFSSAQADINSTIFQRISKNLSDTDTQKGRIYFRRTGKELQMAIDMNSSDPKDSKAKYVLLADGMISLYQPHIDTLTQYILSTNRSDIEGMLALGFGGRGHDLLKSFEVQLTGEETIDGVKTSKLQLTPKTDRVKSMYSSIQLWVDPGRGISLRQQFWEPSESYRLVNFSNIKTGEKLSDNIFKVKKTSKTNIVRP